MPLDGWIKLYREIVNKDIYVQPPLYLKVFERLVMEANRSCRCIPYNKSTKLIKRGERLTSIRQIAEWVGWYERGIFKIPNPKTIVNILDWLIKKEMIEILNRGNSQETHYNIVNYCIYQAKDDNESNAQVTVTGEVSIQQLDTNKKGKKDKKLKKVLKDIYIIAQNLSLSKKEYDKLTTEYGQQIVDDKIEYAKNYAKLKNYTSLYLTLNNWLKSDKEKTQTSNPFL